jgi:hypothetical protein
MSSSPHLADQELTRIRQLLDTVRSELDKIAQGDLDKLHHGRRYIMKRLEFDERGTPAQRKNLRLALMAKQMGICPICKDPDRPLPARESELDRIKAALGYTLENTRLVHHECHRKSQAERNYS